ncbi:MAG: rhodanese-like domain-containing protein [Alphaproteobacteria bacterium]|nr:rhodanese-like domain-containing protein [Alphaproteobacteria bacterium]
MPMVNTMRMAHWFLAVTAALVLFTSAAAAAEPKLSAPDAQKLADTGAITIVDVRSPVEWRQTGIPAGALAVTIHDPRGEAGFVEAILTAVGGDRKYPIALICASGVRSHRARQWLVAEGFTNISDVSEGMLGRGDEPGWLRRGLPTEPCPVC